MFPQTFNTRHLLLRPITPADARPIFDAYAQDAEVTRFLTWRRHRSRDETASYIAECLSIPASVSRTYVLVGRGDVAVRGAFELRRDSQHRIGFGYVLARRWWGHGLMTEALVEIVGWALRNKSIWRIGDVCDVENIASARVMEKAGLIREGVLRRWAVHPNVSDQPRDCFSYARVRLQDGA